MSHENTGQSKNQTSFSICAISSGDFYRSFYSHDLSGPENIALYVAIAAVLMALLIFAVLYWYFRDQSKTMNEAIEQIREYISGNRNARIECDDEGDLYRLFHEVNSLVTILNAHAENEGRAKAFMKDTISDISHQLKTPLAASTFIMA